MIPIKIDKKGKISVEGTILNCEGQYRFFLITNGEEIQYPEHLKVFNKFSLTNVESTPIYYNYDLRVKFCSKLITAYGQQLRIKVSNLRYYKRKNEQNLWLTKNSIIEYLDPEKIYLPEPKIWDIVAINKDDSFLMWNGSNSFEKTLEELKEKMVLLTDKSLQWLYENNLF